MPSPPGTSPTPVLPRLSCRMTMLRVKKGPCAPHRLSSMLSYPATGTTCIPVTRGVPDRAFMVTILLSGRPRGARRATCNATIGIDASFEHHALDLADDEQVADHRHEGVRDDVHQRAVERRGGLDDVADSDRRGDAGQVAA